MSTLFYYVSWHYGQFQSVSYLTPNPSQWHKGGLGRSLTYFARTSFKYCFLLSFLYFANYNRHTTVNLMPNAH